MSSNQFNLNTLFNFTALKSQYVLKQLKASATRLSQTIPRLPSVTLKVNNEYNYLEERYKYYIKPTYLPTRNPVVLCHGLYGFDKFGPINYPKLQIKYWNGIEDCLRKLGCEVFVTKVDRVGTIEKRAKQLHQQLQAKYNYEPINIIGHSMGGLDARLVTNLNVNNRKYDIQSITSICTPHRGCSFVDWCQDYLKVGLPPQTDPNLKIDLSWQQNQILFTIIKKLFEVPAYYNLTSQFMAIFNKQVTDKKNIRYFSVAAKTAKPPAHPLLWIPYYIVKGREGDNDGMVSVRSATWGTFLNTLDTTHFQVVSSNRYIQYFNDLYAASIPKLDILLDDFNLLESFNKKEQEKVLNMEDKKAGFDPIPFYLELITKLNREGL